MSGKKPWMKFPFIIQGKFMYLIVSHNKLTKFTKVQLGKDCATVKGKKINQDGLWPVVMVCTDMQFKLAVAYEDKNNIFDVKVDDQPYVWLPYVAPNQNYGDAEDELFTAMIVVNDKIVIDEAIHWNFFSISEQVEVKLGDQNLTTFGVKNLECQSYVTNELLDVIASQMISEEDGLAQIVLHNFKERCGPFDESLLDRFAKSSIKL